MSNFFEMDKSEKMNWKWICCLLFYIINLSSGNNFYHHSDRIMNGIDVYKHYLWIVSIHGQVFNFNTRQYIGNFEHACGGSIISHRFIVTAAHCVFYTSGMKSNSYCPKKFFLMPPSRLQVVAGHTNLSQADDADKYGVKRVIYHSQYKVCTHENDIALLELQYPLTRTHLILGISNQLIEPGVKSVIAGWGNRCSVEANNKIKQLSYANMVVKRINQCHQQLTLNKPIDTMLCAGTEGRSVQQRDSGSGLWVVEDKQPKLIGLVSMAMYCRQDHCNSLYTRLSFYREWIWDNMNSRPEL